jgi:cobalamin biosynthesis Mg chelatase CobN
VGDDIVRPAARRKVTFTMDKSLLRTTHAASAAALSSQFTLAIADQRVGGHKGDMTAPEASTAKGVQALQHIRLIPADGTSGRVYVVGNANKTDERAELRTLEYVDRVSVERWDEKTGFDPEAYEKFLDKAEEVLGTFGLKVTRVAMEQASRRPLSPSTPPWIFIAIAALLLLAGLVAGYALARSGGPH